MDSTNRDVDSKVEPWPQEAPVGPQTGFPEVDLNQHRQDQEHLSQASNNTTSQHTSEFSSYSVSESSAGILEDDDRQRDPASRAASVPSSVSGTGGQTARSSGHISSDGAIPPHCRMDELNPPLINPNRSRTTQSSAAGFGNSKHANWRSPSRQEITSVGDDFMRNERSVPSSHPATLQKPDNPGLSKRKRNGRKAVPKPPSAAEPQRISADVDEEKLKKVEKKLGKFTRQIDTAILIPHLKPCLSQDNYTHIRRQIEVGESRLKVNQLLWKYLKRAPRWWIYLEEALDRCGYEELLAIMQE